VTIDSVLGDRRWTVLTGAGVSTDSGIPDYRGPQAVPRKPMTGKEFRSGLPAQQRYWARAYLGWAAMGAAMPNTAHRLLAAFEDAGRIDAVITQNVDGLHTAAGQRRVVDLHGRVDPVICLDCAATSARSELQGRLRVLNPGFGADDLQVLPDGDVAFDSTHDFVLADCVDCGGRLKPDVVFFGENVPVDRVEECHDLIGSAEALVVLGSSLHVFSGRRFVKQAYQRGIPIVIVNRGETRSDDLASLKLDAGCAETLGDYAALTLPGRADRASA